MAGDFGLVYPPWNHSTKSDNLLDRVVGEVGIDHLTVPVVTGEQAQFRLSGGFETPYFHTAGGWHFHPQPKLYEPSGIHPRTADWLGSRDVVSEIRDQAAKLGLKLIFRVDLPMIPSMVESAPQMRFHSAWGDLPGFGPCISNPDYRELISATLADLARFDPDGFELDNLWLEPAGLASATTQLDNLAQLGEPAGMCFCPSCRQEAAVANVDADAAAQAVRARANWLASRSPEELAAARPWRMTDELQAYLDARRSDMRAWLTRVADAHAPRRMFLVDSLGGACGGKRVAELAGPRWTWLGRVLREILMIMAGLPDRQHPTTRDTSSLRAVLHLSEHEGLTWPVWTPKGPGPDGLVRLVSAAVSDGLEFLDFAGLEESPPGVVTWLKQAVRFARRG